jgi:hypothetical protein
MLLVDSYPEADSESANAEPQLNMPLSSEAISIGASPTTFKFQGMLHGHSVLMLVDSGSSHSFVSTSLLTSLSGISAASRPIHVRVANGQVIQCLFELE